MGWVARPGGGFIWEGPWNGGRGEDTSKSTPLNEGKTDTLTIINKDTDEVVRQGTTGGSGSGGGSRGGGGTGLPSVTGGAKTQEEFEAGLRDYIQKQPDVLPKTLTYQQEQVLKNQLGQPTQTTSLNILNPGLGASGFNYQQVQQSLNTPTNFRSIEDKRIIEEAYVKSQADKVFVEQQRVLEAKKKLYNQAVYGQQKELVVDKNKIILPGQKGYYELGVKNLPSKEPARQPLNVRTLGPPKKVVDISQEDFKKGVDVFKKETPGSGELIIERLDKRLKNLSEVYSESFKDSNVFVGTKKVGVFGTTFVTGADYKPQQDMKGFFDSLGVKTIAAGYDTLSDVLGQTVVLSRSTLGRGNIGRTQLIKYESEGILNPRQAALEELMSKQKQMSEETLSDFYLGKQVAETGMFLYGGSVATLAGVGSAARSEKIEEAIVPLVLGGVGRVAAKPLGGLISGATSKTNKLIAYVESKIIPKTPVPQNVLVPNVLPRITESAAAKGLMFVGGSVEVIGMQLTPLEQKQEYLRQVGLFNAYTPLGYRVTDVGLMLGKRAAIQSLDIGFDVVKKTIGKDIRGFDTTQYSVVAGEDLMKTPKLVGSEKEMLLATQDITRPGAAKFVYEKFGIVPAKKGVGYGFRSVSGKLGDVIEPKVSYYEGTKLDFFAPEVNPIAMRDIGLKSKLLGKIPGIYDEYSLIPAKPSLRLREFSKATSVSLKPGTPFTDKTLKDLYDIYGWKGLDLSFSKEVKIGGIKVPVGKTVGQVVKEKILSGGLGRPVKSREFINLTSEEVFEKLFTDMPKSKVVEFGGAVSSPSRSLGATSESEFITAVGGVRAPPTTRVREFFRKLGFADAYVSYDFEMIPLNYEKIGKSFDNGLVPFSNKIRIGDRKLLGTEQKLIGENNLLEAKQKNLLLSGSGSSVDVKKNFVGVSASPKVVDVSGMGDYSKELSETFGKRSLFGRSLFKPMIVSEPVLVSKANGSYSSKNVLSVGDYDSSFVVKDSVYLGGYDRDYSVKYVDPYVVPYVPKRGSSYETAYTPSYTPDYTPPYNPPYVPTRTPPYNPPYVPTRTPPYNPPYVPTRTPPYNPPYVPTRTPPYNPPYVPTRTPPYNPPYTPPYKLRMNQYNLPQYGSSSKQKGYFSLVKKKGKWKKLDKTPRTFNAAWNKAATNADKTLSQSIKIIEANTPAVGREETLRLGKFKPSKRTLGVFVEKKKYALERDEIVEIKSAKKQKQGIGRFKLSL